MSNIFLLFMKELFANQESILHNFCILGVFRSNFQANFFSIQRHPKWLIFMDLTSVRMINFDILQVWRNRNHTLEIVFCCTSNTVRLNYFAALNYRWTQLQNSLFSCKLDVAIGYRSLKLPSQPFSAWGSLDTQQVISTSNPLCKVSAKFTA